MDAKKSNKQRIEAVFRGKIPDRVPNFEVLVDNPTLSHVMGRTIPAHTLDNIPPEDYLEFARRVGQDVIGLCFYSNPFYYECSDGEMRPMDFRITCRKDWKRIVAADISRLEGRFALLDHYEQTVQDTDVGLFVLLGSFFTNAYDSVFGFENFMYMLYDDLVLVEEVVAAGADYCVEIAKRVVQKNLTFFYVGDDIAFKSATLIHPDLLRKIFLPHLKRVFQPAIEKGIPILYHSDGNIRALIPDLIDLGINALNPIEPYGMDIAEIKQEFGCNIALVGNLDVGGSLSCGSEEDVRRDTQVLIDAVGRDGGLVVASSHSITRNVKPENYLAMVETTQNYGRYT